MKVQFNNLYTHFVFTTRHREMVIPERSRERIEKYFTGIIRKHGCQLYAIYANPDHVHFLVSRVPNMDEETLADIIACSSARFINSNQLCDRYFQWQGSWSAFSVSKANVDRVCGYILNQPNHHKKRSRQEEFETFLKFYQKLLIPKNENKVKK
jgi:REP element-mobilizing transposase RayT